MATPQTPTAHDAYVAQQSRFNELLSRLSSTGKAHATAHDADQRNWHLVGDLATTCDHLDRALRGLGAPTISFMAVIGPGGRAGGGATPADRASVISAGGSIIAGSGSSE